MTSHLNQYSLRRIAQLNAEYPIRLKLIRRCDGHAIESIQTVRRGFKKFTIKRVACFGGICENCHQRRYYLVPHEKKHRSQGGVLSLENTVMVCCDCHRLIQGSDVRLDWLPSLSKKMGGE